MGAMLTVREMELSCDALEPPECPEHPLKLPELSLSNTFFPLGFPLQVRTNSATILEMCQRLWGQFTHQHVTTPMRYDVYVTEGGTPDCPPAPSYQYAEPLFVSIADAQHYGVVDMAHGITTSSITKASLQHSLYIEHFFLMLSLGTIPAKAIHAACVAWKGSGILLCGDSGAGKSTLAYACARAGWEYISDDGSFVLDCDEPWVTGNCNLVRFRPSAAGLFPEIRGLDETPRAAGKPSIELSTLALDGIARRHQVRVKAVVFLNRGISAGAQLSPYSKDVARLYMRQGIYGTPAIRMKHYAAIERLLNVDVFQLHYEKLQHAIECLRRYVEEGR